MPRSYISRGSRNPRTCAVDAQTNATMVFQSVVEAPLLEESVQRGIPSVILDVATKQNPVRNFLQGTGGYRMDRGEFITGAISTALFAASHNVTDKGFDTHTIPAPQGILGAAAWYLQRKFGFLTNLLAHSTNNAITVGTTKLT